MAKKMTKLDLCWKNCMSQWRWIYDRIKEGDKRTVDELKEAWMKKHGFSEIEADCFFCEYDYQRNNNCDSCPGKLVDLEFECRNMNYHFFTDPLKFYPKLRALNRKRLKK